jgi:hypothetical protein
MRPPVGGGHRRAVGLRPWHGAPWGPPLQPPRHQRAGRPAPSWPATAGQPPPAPAHPEVAGPAQGLDDRPAVAAAWPTRPQPAHAASTPPAGRLLAASSPGRQGRPGSRAGAGRPAPCHRWAARGAVVLAEDETHLNLLPWVRATWITCGTCQQVMTPGTNRRRTIFGAVDLRTGRFFYQVAPKAVSAGCRGRHALRDPDRGDREPHPPILRSSDRCGDGALPPRAVSRWRSVFASV